MIKLIAKLTVKIRSPSMLACTERQILQSEGWENW